eukprot:SAG11_NODE_20446_length_445_cov_0.598266_1_plen_76_part_10
MDGAKTGPRTLVSIDAKPENPLVCIAHTNSHRLQRAARPTQKLPVLVHHRPAVSRCGPTEWWTTTVRPAAHRRRRW